MARGSSFASIIREVQRQQIAAVRQQQREAAAAQREAERARKAYERAQLADEKERKRLYVESRVAEVAARNEQLEAEVARLEGILPETLAVDDYLDFESLKSTPEIPPFEPGPLAVPEAPPREQLPNYSEPPAPSGMRGLMPGAKAKHAEAVADTKRQHEEALARSRQSHRAHLAAHAQREQTREAALAEATARHQSAEREAIAAAVAANREIEQFKADFEVGKPEAIVSYFGLVLSSSSYPEGFPQSARTAYVPESRQLVVEYELPTFEIVPTAGAYKYVKTSDDITETARPVTKRKAIYASLLSQVVLRTIHELFEADRSNKIDTIVLNGFVDTVNVATGARIKPCLISVRTTKDVFMALDLSQVDPHACLKGLNAGVSKSPAELAPVRPVLEFNMVDARFVEESDVLSNLDQRPNLMDLTPSEFESLITNLFAKMGLDTRMTQASRDGGVDCVAYDPRPVLGGKVVIQAKRYKNTVGVSAVRDLFGTMHNEGASKGILVTTSGYGKAAFDFATDKPLELLDGSNLLYLLSEHAGIEAKIEVPEDWVDPTPEYSEEPGTTP